MHCFTKYWSWCKRRTFIKRVSLEYWDFLTDFAAGTALCFRVWRCCSVAPHLETAHWHQARISWLIPGCSWADWRADWILSSSTIGKLDKYLHSSSLHLFPVRVLDQCRITIYQRENVTRWTAGPLIVLRTRAVSWDLRRLKLFNSVILLGLLDEFSQNVSPADNVNKDSNSFKKSF